MKHMARIPVQRPRWPSDLSGLCTDLPDVNLKKGSVCLGTIGEAFKRPGKTENRKEEERQEERRRKTNKKMKTEDLVESYLKAVVLILWCSL